MERGSNQHVSPGRVVLMLALLLAGWLGFQFYPRRREIPPPMAPVKAESKLQAVGLADNPDWEGLPELLAVWADHIPWVNDRTSFAYWHTGANAYAYFFEATRGKQGIRFRSVPAREPVAIPIDAARGSLVFDDEELARYAEERRAGSPTHPFVFPQRIDLPTVLPVTSSPVQSSKDSSDGQLLLKPIPFPIPPPKIDLSKSPHAGNEK